MFNDGFLSVVDKSQIPDHLVVRSRVKAHILTVFPDAKVRATPNADYQFRADINRQVVAVAIANRIQNIDYDNFKNSISNNKLHDACSRVWSVMFSLVEPVRKKMTGRNNGAGRQREFDSRYWPKY